MQPFQRSQSIEMKMNQTAKLDGKGIFRLFQHPLGTSVRLIEMLKGLFPQSKGRIFKDAADFWKSSRSLQSIRDHSHWLGEGGWANEKRWDEWGKWNYGIFKKLCSLSGNGRAIKSIAEWGPGGGANAVWFCREVSLYYGIDISEANLNECARQLKARGFEGFQSILIDIEQPEKCLSLIGPPVDFFFSTAVFQHFPNQEYGWLVTEIAHKMLASEGTALIQVRYDDGSKRFKPKHRDYAKNMSRFNSSKIHDFWVMAAEIGFTPLALILEPKTCYAYYYLQKIGQDLRQPFSSGGRGER